MYQKQYQSSRRSRQRALRKRRRNIILAAAAILVVAVGGIVLAVHTLTPKTSDPTNVVPQTGDSDISQVSSITDSSPVSYTHLDVYKRQDSICDAFPFGRRAAVGRRKAQHLTA